jgi:hypothetical protein
MNLKRIAAMLIHFGLRKIEKRSNRRERVRDIDRREDRDRKDAAAKRIIDPRCQQAAEAPGAVEQPRYSRLRLICAAEFRGK